MWRTVLLALGLIGFIACGGGRKQVARGKSAAASRSAPSRHRTATKASSGRHKGTARADTTTQKSPLTNH
jgi:hypothetical protein